MTDQDQNADFFSSDAKVAECRRQSDQLNYFAYSYCKLYGDWRDGISRMQTERQRQPLVLVLIIVLCGGLMAAVYATTSSPALASSIVLLGGAAAYVAIERARREEERLIEIKRSKERFSTTLFLAGVDLHLSVLEETITKDTAGEWVFTPKFNDWRDDRLQSIFHRVYGVSVPKDVIDKICSYGV